MTTPGDNVLALKSTKAQLEVGLIYLKRRHAELERQVAAVEGQGRQNGMHPDALAHLRRTLQEHAVQIERRKLEIAEIDDQIHAAQARSEHSGTQHLAHENEAVTQEIAAVREEVLALLRQLAEPLRRYEHLAERKNQLSRDLSTRTGRDQAYTNYIEGALLRQSEFVDDVKYAVEALRRQRVVA
jgi:chromosome segregation ATPase